MSQMFTKLATKWNKLMQTKKVIEPILIKQHEKYGNIFIKHSEEVIDFSQIYMHYVGNVHKVDYRDNKIEKSKAREVALAICPELGEPTIKSDNTKVIKYLEDQKAKLLDALIMARNILNNQVPEYVIWTELEIINALIQQSETK